MTENKLAGLFSSGAVKVTQPTNKLAGVFQVNDIKHIVPPVKEKSVDKLMSEGGGVTKKTINSLNALFAPKESISRHLREDALKETLKEAVLKAEQESLNAIPVLQLDSTTDAVKWDESQLAALNGLQQEQFGILIGAAGTGKTTLTRELIKRLEKTTPLVHIDQGRKFDETAEKRMNVAIAFAAFTGTAVQNMKRAIPKEYHTNCDTIHAMLGYMPTEDAYFDEKTNNYKNRILFKPTFTSTNKMPWEVIVLDEAGMIPIPLFNEIIAAMKPTCRIILVGDINQLPPVFGRSVLGFAMTKWPVYELTTIHRTAQDNPIIKNAHNILKGMLPGRAPGKVDIFNLSDSQLTAQQQFIGLIKKLHKEGEFDPLRDAIIVTQNTSEIGQVRINEYLTSYFNPPRKDGGIIINPRYVIQAGREHFGLAVGDKVMLLQNDRQRGLTNGMEGIVVSINENGSFKGKQQSSSVDNSFDKEQDLDFGDMDDMLKQMKEQDIDVSINEEEEGERQASHITTIQFKDGQEVTFATVGQYKKFNHSYACTVHKKQGGEAPVVVILIHSSNSIMLYRELLYTAFTRAQLRVVLACNTRGLMQAVRNQRIVGKSVREKAAAFIALQKDLKGENEKPNLPEPKKIIFKAA